MQEFNRRFLSPSSIQNSRLIWLIGAHPDDETGPLVTLNELAKRHVIVHTNITLGEAGDGNAYTRWQETLQLDKELGMYTDKPLGFSDGKLERQQPQLQAAMHDRFEVLNPDLIIVIGRNMGGWVHRDHWGPGMIAKELSDLKEVPLWNYWVKNSQVQITPEMVWWKLNTIQDIFKSQQRVLPFRYKNPWNWLDVDYEYLELEVPNGYRWDRLDEPRQDLMPFSPRPTANHYPTTKSEVRNGQIVFFHSAQNGTGCSEI